MTATNTTYLSKRVGFIPLLAGATGGFLSRPADASSLVIFRILFGCIMAVAMARFLAKGWVKTLYLDPAFHFPWFSWIRPWHGDWMYVHVAALGFLAIGIACGFFYKCCAGLFFLGFTYLELIDRTTYLNHYYLISLLSGLLIVLPAHRKWSLDAWLNPQRAAESVPFWTIALLRFQLAVVFIFAGLAKLNSDWLFEAQPMRMWLAARSDLPLVGTWLVEPWAAYVASWLGAAYDLSISFLLLISRTRPFAFLTVILFHAMTAVLFPIGMFPWIMIAASLIFFAPDWPKRWLRRFIPGTNRTEAQCASQARLAMAGKILLAGYCAAQILIPLRSWLYPQQGAWDVRGFNFAWRVMLVEKTGHAEFYHFNPADGTRKRIPLHRYITPRQRMMMAQDPFLIRVMADFLGREYRVQETGTEIRVEAFATLNGKPSQSLVRSDINLAGALPPNWIVPLQTDNKSAQPVSALSMN
jgi:vitamin K-dependent gamma-carboxylase